MIPTSFSIDFLTRSDRYRPGGSGNDVARCSTSPDPQSSSCHSESESSTGDNSESIAEVLLSLDKTIKNGISGDPSKEKPPHSYIALISMAILSNSDQKMLLSDIYQYVMDNFPYYNNKEKAWRNSIRHNLSLNECFVKNGRAGNGKGNFWSIHPACVEDFARGDFRRRQARRRARKSMKAPVDRPIRPDCSYNLGYVPMTPSPIGYHGYPHQVLYSQKNFHSIAQVPSPMTSQHMAPMSSPSGYFSPMHMHHASSQSQQFLSSSVHPGGSYPQNCW
ncbi:forkhead box protein unc-130-like [Saccostrea cucullata]|uniref:forkhead box protein unc-130-like n=1 Tax=Saccostrea cuccullata TaxID=36930 RepID=UPI002ED3BCA7